MENQLVFRDAVRGVDRLLTPDNRKTQTGYYLGDNEYGVLRTLKHYFDPDYVMNPGGTLGLDLKPEQRKFLREHPEYTTVQEE